MKIPHLHSASQTDKPVKPAKTAGPVENQAPRTLKTIAMADPPLDAVSLSQRSKVVQKIAEQLKQVPDIREEKVEILRSKIQNGSYWVDPAEIADKMLAEFLSPVL